MTRARLAAEVELLELEVIAAEVEAGWSIPGAARPLHPWERRARTRFADLERIADDAAGMIARHMGDVTRATTAALLEDLWEHSYSVAALLARVNDLLSPRANGSLPLGGTLAHVQAAIEHALAGARHAAADELLDEARRQGVPEVLIPDAMIVGRIDPIERATIVEAARHLTEQPMTRIMQAAATEVRSRAVAGADPGRVLDDVETALGDLKDAGADDARQAATRAANQGRAAAARDAPEPAEVYASELLDGRTCGPCADVDGRMYDSLASALVDYPSGGSYAGCLGGSRCRGTLVLVWETEQAPTLDHAPTDRPGRFPIDRTPRGPSVAVDQALPGA